MLLADLDDMINFPLLPSSKALLMNGIRRLFSGVTNTMTHLLNLKELQIKIVKPVVPGNVSALDGSIIFLLQVKLSGIDRYF